MHVCTEVCTGSALFFRNYIICTAPVQMFVQMPVQIPVQAVRYLFRKGPGFVVRK